MMQPIRTTRQTRGQAKAAEQAEEDRKEIESEEDTPQENEEEVSTTKKNDTTSKMDQQALMETFGKLMTQQNETLERILERLDKPVESTSSTLKSSELYLFKSTSRQNEISVRIFVERIEDVRRIYKNQSEKLALLLPRYLDNEITYT